MDKKKAIIVDDNEDMRYCISELIASEYEDLEVFEFDNFDDCLNNYDDINPDVVIVDLCLDKNGLNDCKQGDILCRTLYDRDPSFCKKSILLTGFPEDTPKIKELLQSGIIRTQIDKSPVQNILIDHINDIINDR